MIDSAKIRYINIDRASRLAASTVVRLEAQRSARLGDGALVVADYDAGHLDGYNAGYTAGRYRGIHRPERKPNAWRGYLQLVAVVAWMVGTYLISHAP